MILHKFVATFEVKSIEYLNENDCNNFILANPEYQKISYDEDIIFQNFPKWTEFKNAIFENKTLLFKCMPCNAYPLVADMIISAEAGANVYESNFLLGWQLLQSQLVGKGTPLTVDEIAFINQNLALYDFSITI
jgi:hypothetical protein